MWSTRLCKTQVTTVKRQAKWHDWFSKCILGAHKVMLTCQTLTSWFKLHIFREYFWTVLTIKCEVWHLKQHMNMWPFNPVRMTIFFTSMQQTLLSECGNEKKKKETFCTSAHHAAGTFRITLRVRFMTLLFICKGPCTTRGDIAFELLFMFWYVRWVYQSELVSKCVPQST